MLQGNWEGSKSWLRIKLHQTVCFTKCFNVYELFFNKLCFKTQSGLSLLPCTHLIYCCKSMKESPPYTFIPPTYRDTTTACNFWESQNCCSQQFHNVGENCWIIKCRRFLCLHKNDRQKLYLHMLNESIIDGG